MYLADKSLGYLLGGSALQECLNSVVTHRVQGERYHHGLEVLLVQLLQFRCTQHLIKIRTLQRLHQARKSSAERGLSLVLALFPNRERERGSGGARPVNRKEVGVGI